MLINSIGNCSATLKDDFADEKQVMPEYTPMLGAIEYNDKTILGFDEADELNLWDDYLVAIEQYVENR